MHICTLLSINRECKNVYEGICYYITAPPGPKETGRQSEGPLRSLGYDGFKKRQPVNHRAIWQPARYDVFKNVGLGGCGSQGLLLQLDFWVNCKGHWSCQAVTVLTANKWVCHFTQRGGGEGAKRLRDWRMSGTSRVSGTRDSQKGQDFPRRWGASITAYDGSKASLPSCPGWWKMMSKRNSSHSSM